MTTASHTTEADSPKSELKRSITGKQLYFYVVGDVLGSGIYVLVGLVAAAVGGAFWMAFLAGVAIAAITGLAYAELVTKYPQAAGASLYINKAFRSPLLTFFITICMLSANMAAVGRWPRASSATSAAWSGCRRTRSGAPRWSRWSSSPSSRSST